MSISLRLKRPGGSILLGMTALLGCVGAYAAEKEPFSKREKAYYLSPQEQAFIRPGLSLEILEASIDEDAVIRARFRATDPAGAPLDRNGILTPGPVDTRFIVAYIPAGERQYTSYITRTRTNSVTNAPVIQATSDSGGVYEQVGDGEYVYTFATRAPATIDRSVTHTIGVYARRDLREFGLERPSDDDTFDFVPDGSEVTVVRDIVRTETCNNCHTRLTLHGRRHSVELCVLCHQPQSLDDESENTVDFPVMIHKIHMGADLPSVQNGTPYTVAGRDYSTVEFPADVRRCKACHTQESDSSALREVEASSRPGGIPIRARSSALAEEAKDQTQGLNYLSFPSRDACGSCHDDVVFATGENHAELPQISDSQCSRCHVPEGELEFDLSIIGSHTIERFSKELKGVNFEILGVTDTGPGERPTVTFSVRDNDGNALVPSEMNRLRLMMAGPMTDITRLLEFEDARSAEGSGGVYHHTFETPIPDDAEGSWAVGIEGRNLQTLLEGTLQERTDVRDLGENKVFYFPVTETEAMPRRKIVAQEKCESCHYKLREHGGNRSNVDYCVLCHNITATDEEERLAEQLPGQTINFKQMIHAIHSGTDLDDPDAPYVLFDGGEPIDFSGLRFPGDRRECTICHIEGTFELPLQNQKEQLPVNTPYDFLTVQPPISGACLSCHNSLPAAAHADLNISPNLGESCEVCHGVDAEFSVSRVHAR